MSKFTHDKGHFSLAIMEHIVDGPVWLLDDKDGKNRRSFNIEVCKICSTAKLTKSFPKAIGSFIARDNAIAYCKSCEETARDLINLKDKSGNYQHNYITNVVLF